LNLSVDVDKKVKPHDFLHIKTLVYLINMGWAFFHLNQLRKKGMGSEAKG